MNPMDMGALGGLFGGFQQKMEDIKRRAAETEVDGSAGGLVTVRMTCDFNIVSIAISPDAMEDREMLEDLIRAASNEALRKAQDHTKAGLASLTAGLPIPPGMIPGL